MKCKECIYFEEPTCHGHGEYWGYCKIIEKLLKHYDKEIENYNNELEKRLKGFFDDNEILNMKISYCSGTKGFEDNCTINKFTQIINKTLKANNIKYELRTDLMTKKIFDNSIETKFPGFAEDWETTRKRLIKKQNVINELFKILQNLSEKKQEFYNSTEKKYKFKKYKYKNNEYYIFEQFYNIADFLIENDFRLR